MHDDNLHPFRVLVVAVGALTALWLLIPFIPNAAVPIHDVAERFRTGTPVPTASTLRLVIPAHAAAEDDPWGNPTHSTRVVMTQGYDVGTHAPAAVWGGIDLAIDGDGDGDADPAVSMGAPVYATMNGIVETQADTMPAGNHLWIKNERYKVGYGHLKAFAVENGQTVQRGDLIGYMGSTGQSSGPHLHYHIWQDGINVNPLDFGALP